MNGWEVLAKLREMRLYDLKVVFVSILKAEEYAKHKEQEEDYEFYITKPFNNKILVDKVLSVLSKKD